MKAEYTKTPSHDFRDAERARKYVASVLARQLRISSTEMQQLMDCEKQIRELQQHRQEIARAIIANNYGG